MALAGENGVVTGGGRLWYLLARDDCLLRLLQRKRAAHMASAGRPDNDNEVGAHEAFIPRRAGAPGDAIASRPSHAL